MEIRTACVAAAVALCLGVGAVPAQAQDKGIIACQISLSQFAEDVAASKARLTPVQMKQARDIVDVGRSQCRSGTDLVLTDIRTARVAMHLQTGRRLGTQFSDFWPARPAELASLSR